MKKYTHTRLRAILLRKKGKSYGEIGNMLQVPKSTLSYWLKQVPVSEDTKIKFYNQKIRNLTLGSQSSHERRKREVADIVQNAANEIKAPLSGNTYTLFGAALYWAEGTKRGMLEFTNSDPLMVVFMVQWILDMFNVPAILLKAKMNIYEQQNEQDIKSFWSDLTGIPIENFGKSYIKPRSKNVKKNTLYYGTIKVVVPKSVDKKLKIFGWIEGVMRPYHKQVLHVRRKWDTLGAVERPVNLL